MSRYQSELIRYNFAEEKSHDLKLYKANFTTKIQPH